MTVYKSCMQKTTAVSTKGKSGTVPNFFPGERKLLKLWKPDPNFYERGWLFL